MNSDLTEISELSEKSIKLILTIVENEIEINASLPGGGILHIEKELPYLIIYRQIPNDPETHRMVISESSYLIIGTSDFTGYQKLLFELSNLLSTKFKSYLLLELYSGEQTSTSFILKGPEKKLPTTLKVLKEELDSINSTFSGLYLKTEIKDTTHRQAKGEKELLSIEEAKQCGALVLGLEIPPIYRDETFKTYPVFFRNFRDFINRAVHIAIFDYIRVQTSCGVASFNALGRKYLKEKVFEIDKKLADIENSFQFLWLVSPINIHEIKETFIESKYKKLLDYHYRLLPIDPDVLKRKLYNLKIEDIDDPAMSYLFREKREELDQQITMLSERGTKNFLYDSVRLYQGINPHLFSEAKQILEKIPEVAYTETDQTLDCKAFSSLARKEFDFFRNQDENFKCKVHIRKDVNIMMVSQGELYIPEDYKLSEIDAKGLIQHEVGTHVLTYHNGLQQPLKQLSIGLADYDPLQEGLAVMSEYLVDALTPNRLRTLAGRVIAGEAVKQGGDFQEIFRLLTLTYDFSPERAFNITSRIMQGGGFLKDIIYLKGLVDLRKYLQEGGDYESLLTGKFALKHTKIIEELTDRKVLKTGTLRPSYLLNEESAKRIKLIRDGLPISQMITK
ncbi:flavohemoglobin expression-modulating QEGLA motif protein [Gillisia hiemivivida]|jgi:uncharacterized protein (TIGR02421 family)|uniref:DUF1704 domain-containing protein n=1 Tax=Gillisia hiemivivida TaxID=291190 RepID=A0A5C6ZXP6_9FLAO|nr:tyrosine/phenylalanine carboxypeptidase domain-containing protein [Gillisia hiemivivida]TXD95091.1 DUF1704 domain-containing protein [Gillisia hiemivivida]